MSVARAKKLASLCMERSFLVQQNKAKARQSKGSCAQLFALGYEVLPIAPYNVNGGTITGPGKQPALKQGAVWRAIGIEDVKLNYPATAETVVEWDSWGANAAIHCSGTGVCGIDIDILVKERADAINAIAEEKLGITWTRIGLAPKRLLPYACDPDTAYRCWKHPDGGLVELIAGNNHMFVAGGIHPVTTLPFNWPRGIPQRSQLPVVTEAELDQFFACLLETFPGSTLSTQSRYAIGDQGALAGDMDALDDALAFLPNHYPADGYENWMKLMYACRGGYSRDLARGCKAFVKWSEKAVGVDRKAKGSEDPESFFKRNGDSALGAQYIFDLAQARGWPGYEKVIAGDWFEEPAPEAPPTVFPTGYRFPDEKSHPARDFIYGTMYIRQAVSATYAASKVGKSGLIVAEALAMASGKALLGIEPKGPQRVWLWNGEDPIEEIERLVMAAMNYHGLVREDIGDRLLIDSGMTQGSELRLIDGEGHLVEDGFKRVVQGIQAGKVDVFSLDPVVSLGSGKETNEILDALVKELARAAAGLRAAIHLSHHVRKPQGGKKAQETTLDDGRGGGSMTAATRAARALSTMNERDARELGISKSDRRLYFRATDAATNLAPPPKLETHWWRRQSVDLANGDAVGVVTLAGGLATLAPADIEPWRDEVLAELMIDPPVWRVGVTAVDWVGKLFARYMDLVASDPGDRPLIKEKINAWFRLKLVKEFASLDKTRHERVFVVAQAFQGPGLKTDEK